MSKVDDGGPAFPSHGSMGEVTHEGLSLRDWFAGQALAGMLAHSTRYRPLPAAPLNWHEAISQEAYAIADAMLAQRNKEPT